MARFVLSVRVTMWRQFHMETKSRQYAAVRVTLIISLGLLAGLGAAQVRAECNEVVSGLLGPMGITQSNKGNLLVAESGPATPNSARISIVSPQGERRTLVSGLPSGVYFETGQASGPSGLFLHG